MPGHRQIEMDDAVPCSPDATAHLGLLACDELLVKALHLLQHGTPHQGVTAAKFGIPRGIDPVEIQHPDIPGLFRVRLATVPPDDRHI
jgi:hypothetical protein